MACSVESDRQALQRSTESFESRWKNVRQAVSTKRRQLEERLSLCKEFWNEYRNFVEWLNEAAHALKMSDEAGEGLEVSRSRLKRFEVGTSEITTSRDYTVTYVRTAYIHASPLVVFRSVYINQLS